jgi:hypothetical protein
MRPRNGSFTITTSPGPISTASTATSTDIGIEPGWTDMCPPRGIMRPRASKIAQEESRRPLMLGENEVRHA